MKDAAYIGIVMSALFACFCGQAAPDVPAEPDRVRGIEGRVPVYASTNANREAVAWLPADTLFTVRGPLNDVDAWVPVDAPDNVFVWIYRDLVRDGRVVADKSRVRAGAALTYPHVASLDRGERVEVRGSFGDWLKIKPPPGLNFWVLRDHVEPLAESSGEAPAAEEPALEALSPPAGESAILAFTNLLEAAVVQPSTSTPSPAPPPELGGYVLEESPDQGKRVVVEGTLDWGGVGSVRAPFCLVAKQPDGDMLPVCHLLAPELTYGPHIGAALRVEGTRWRVKGSTLPVVLPSSMRLAE